MIEGDILEMMSSGFYFNYIDQYCMYKQFFYGFKCMLVEIFVKYK